jgi:hypothetical protein
MENSSLLFFIPLFQLHFSQIFVYSIEMTPNETEKTESKESEKGSWKEDIEKLDYYYDDSTGYEIYVDDESDEHRDSDE